MISAEGTYGRLDTVMGNGRFNILDTRGCGIDIVVWTEGGIFDRIGFTAMALIQCIAAPDTGACHIIYRELMMMFSEDWDFTAAGDHHKQSYGQA